AAICWYFRLHHSAAKTFEPVVTMAEADLAFVPAALDVDFEGWLGKRKERRPEPHFHVVDLEKRLAELRKNPLQMAEMGAFVDDQTLNLMKHRRVRLVAVAPVGAAGANHPERRLLPQHGAYLHWGCMGAQKPPRAVGLLTEKKGVVHLPCRVAIGEIEFGEVIVVGLDVRPLGDGEPHVGED